LYTDQQAVHHHRHVTIMPRHQSGSIKRSCCPSVCLYRRKLVLEVETPVNMAAWPSAVAKVSSRLTNYVVDVSETQWDRVTVTDKRA